jgi:cephalosporin hydroxylase
MNEVEKYLLARDAQCVKNAGDPKLQYYARDYTDNLIRTNYIKNFTWLGRPILQYPMDLMVMQELIWQIKPDFIIETGIAFGGSTLFYASILDLIGGIGRVIAIDKEIRQANQETLRKSPVYGRMLLIEGSSTNDWVIEEVRRLVKPDNTIMVVLDSDHTEAHVLKELELYSPMVSVGSYIIVCDTAIELWAEKYPFPDRAWGKGNNPMTAVRKFLEQHKELEVDYEVETRAGITGHPNGWLRKVKL